jgi:Tfp pilus assembly protein PilV
MTLITVMVALLIFAFGMLSVASIYSMAVPAVTNNENATDSAALGNQFWALLQADSSLVGALLNAGSGAAVSYTSGSTGSIAALQPWLANVFTNSTTELPNATVTITPGPDAQGNACTAGVSCGVTLQIQWNPGSASNTSTARSQTFNYEVGF